MYFKTKAMRRKARPGPSPSDTPLAAEAEIML
jgi:hypothetical protein